MKTIMIVPTGLGNLFYPIEEQVRRIAQLLDLDNPLPVIHPEGGTATGRRWHEVFALAAPLFELLPTDDGLTVVLVGRCDDLDPSSVDACLRALLGNGKHLLMHAAKEVERVIVVRVIEAHHYVWLHFIDGDVLRQDEPLWEEVHCEL